MQQRTGSWEKIAERKKKVLKRDFEVWKNREKNTCQKGLLTFDSVDVILKKDYFNKSYRVVFSCGTVYYAVQGGSNFWVCGWNPQE